ncbi:MAG: Holliday junction branch migration protein RuvA [Alphaproteobacteria bacterium]|nr:Holliday junction branch migration protein RuvA [Alphaproteobacteria bacterium]MCB9690791.1 Holliday junction branch migration protein RuvA [Alphaproteobacteria bacterium]
MIAMLTGELVHQSANRGVLDVNGVGYEVFATTATLGRWSLAGRVRVHVSTQVREDAITLYGFDDDAERAAFLALLTVSGVGPKMALAALDALGADGLASAVANHDVRALCRIPGVGKKTAQRLALELEGRLAATFTPTAPAATPVATTDPLPLALAQLGYKKSEIDQALAALAADGIPADTDTGERLRHALKTLSGSR